MNSDHIDHEKGWSLPKALKAVDSPCGRSFGKWGWAPPEVMGYDASDGPTQNREGGFVNDRSQWDAHVKDDPKRIMEITKGRRIMKEQVEAGRPFYLQLSHWAVHANLEATAACWPSTRPSREPTGESSICGDDRGPRHRVGGHPRGIGFPDIEDDTYVVYMSDNGSVPNIPERGSTSAVTITR